MLDKNSPAHPEQKIWLINAIKKELMAETELSYLQEMPGQFLDNLLNHLTRQRQLRDAAYEPVFKLMAMLTKLIPRFLTVKLSKENLNPMIMAKVTEYMDIKEASNLARSYEIEVLTEITRHTSPKLTAAIAENIDFFLLQQVIKGMLKKGYFTQLGQAADFMSEKLLSKVIKKSKEIQGLARISNQMQNLKKLHLVLSEITKQKRISIKYELEQLQDSRQEILDIFENQAGLPA